MGQSDFSIAGHIHLGEKMQVNIDLALRLLFIDLHFFIATIQIGKYVTHLAFSV